jgi:PAS domain S-box-containing protein
MLNTDATALVGKLRQTLAWTDLVFANLSEGVLVVNEDLDIIFANDAIAGLLKKQRVFMLGTNVWSQISVRARDGGQPASQLVPGQSLEAYIATLAGRWTLQDERHSTLEITSATLPGLSQAVVVLRDVTEQALDEQELRHSEERLRLTLDTVKDGITYSDSSGHFALYNKEMELLTGYSKEEANTTPNFYETISLEHGDWARSLELTNEIVSISPIRTKTGEVRKLVVGTRKLALQGEDMYLSSYHDVTELEAARDQMRDYNAELERRVREKTDELNSRMQELEELARFPEQNPSPIFKVASGGNLVYSNAAGNPILSHWEISVGQSVPEEIQTPITTALASGTPQNIDLHVGPRIYSVNIVPFPTEFYANLYAREVTQERQIDHMKSEFISLASHQLRTPLTSMRWYSEMLLKQRETFPEKAVEKLEVLHLTSSRLADLVNDLLDINRLDTGELVLNQTNQSLEELILEVVAELRGQAEMKKITLNSTTNCNRPFYFDATLVRQAALNLISNAIKYTPEGGLVELTADQYENGPIHVEVRDTGIGIPATEQGKVFERFFRASNATSLLSEGTGLGLALVKMVVEKHGGTIWFQSAEQVGTVFHFTLPFNQ